MSDTDSSDRRRAERRNVSMNMAFIVDSDHSKIANTAFAVDLSELGARIRPSIRLVPGQQITVIPSEGKTHAVPSRVIWVGGEVSGRNGEAGIAFLEPLRAELWPGYKGRQTRPGT